jgi:methylated-DNA-[protein]-cysteine S-methyltransferase
LAWEENRRYPKEVDRDDKPSIFAQRVYDLVRQIPRGKVVTYGDIAQALGGSSPRAVGQALRRNPYAPQVPCHRVVASHGRIGGFFGKTRGDAWMQKKILLEKEGVAICENVIDLARFRHRF